MSKQASMWASGRCTLTVLAAIAVITTAGAAGVASGSDGTPEQVHRRTTQADEAPDRTSR